MKRRILIIALLIVSFAGKADEGMWLPLFIERLNYTDMQKKGLKLTAEEIYSVNNSSLKDAIVKLGGGFCTGELISKEGLVLTNHHCGFGQVQALSTIENDYLTNGFWAMNKKAELPCKGLSFSILQHMEDVTEKVTEGITAEMTAEQISQKIQSAQKKLVEDAKKDNPSLTVNVKEFFDGNQYLMFVYNTYKDIRLVGVPPSSIGKFGGDTDNWMWPRHTGDFCMFRIYTGSDGNPAEYSDSNVPLQPKKHLPVSLKGVKENDFAMVMGFPGSTDRYLTSFGVDYAVNLVNPTRVSIRDKKLGIWKEDMAIDKKVRLQYASKYASIANYWKYFRGQSEQLTRLKIADLKRSEEKAYLDWANQDQERKAKYSDKLGTIEKNYVERSKYAPTSVYLTEAALGVELLSEAFGYQGIEQLLKNKDLSPDKVKETTLKMKESVEKFWKDYSKETDKRLFAALMEMYGKNVPKDHQSPKFKEGTSKFKGDYNKWANDVFAKSFIADKGKSMQYLDNPTIKALEKDPAYVLIMDIYQHYLASIQPKMGAAIAETKRATKTYIEGLLEMNKDKKMYPNANSTLRLTYGSVLPYYPKDGVFYDYLTTANGILEKEMPGDLEFDVPAKLKELILKKDFGDYGVNGSLPVNFLTNNDITGGNSGSPVINAEGHLIGTAFDGNWEAMSGDISFERNVQRCINVDIRYTLFIIDKFGGAKHLVDEMTIIR